MSGVEDAPMLPWPSYDARSDAETLHNLERLVDGLDTGAAEQLLAAVCYLEEVRRLAGEGAASDRPEAGVPHRPQLAERARAIWEQTIARQRPHS
jgi:hypothetical protein